MKIGYITPFKHLELSNKGGIVFVLIKETIENNKYRNYIKQQIKNGTEVYQDANIHEKERKQIDFDEAMYLILKEKLCTTIIIPDSMFLMQETLDGVNDFLKKYYKKCKEAKIEIMAVCQGKNINEVIKSFKLLNNNPKIDRIGIPFDNSFISVDNEDYINQLFTRLYLLYRISHFKIKKKIHCLGCNGVAEAKFASLFPFVYSLDSKLFTRLVLANIRITNENWLYLIKPKKRMYFTSKLNKKQIKIFKQNIKFMKNLLKC